MAEILAILLGVMKFWGEVTWFIQLLQGTPAEQRADMIARIRAASQKADDTKGDTSGYEDILKG